MRNCRQTCQLKIPYRFFLTAWIAATLARLQCGFKMRTYKCDVCDKWHWRFAPMGVQGQPIPQPEILKDMMQTEQPRNQINISKERFTPLQTLAEKLKAKQ